MWFTAGFVMVRSMFYNAQATELIAKRFAVKCIEDHLVFGIITEWDSRNAASASGKDVHRLEGNVSQ